MNWPAHPRALAVIRHCQALRIRDALIGFAATGEGFNGECAYEHLAPSCSPEESRFGRRDTPSEALAAFAFNPVIVRHVRDYLVAAGVLSNV